MRALFAKTFKTKTRDEWCKVFEGSDACFAPVLSWSEARRDPHNVARKVFIRGGKRGAAVARAALLAHARRACGARRRSAAREARQALQDWGFEPDRHHKAEQSLGLGMEE